MGRPARTAMLVECRTRTAVFVSDSEDDVEDGFLLRAGVARPGNRQRTSMLVDARIYSSQMLAAPGDLEQHEHRFLFAGGWLKIKRDLSRWSSTYSNNSSSSAVSVRASQSLRD